MGKLVHLTLVAGFCAALLLMGSIGANKPPAGDAVALQQVTITPTEGTCPIGDPVATDWQLYMSDQPLLTGMSPPDEPPPREVFETGTRHVYAVFRTPCGQKVLPQYTVSVQIRNRNNGVEYESGPLIVPKNQWQFVEWAVPAGRAIPSGGSPYDTRLFWLNQSRPGQADHVEWVVGVSVRFDREAYTGTDDTASLTVIDYSAAPDKNVVTAHVSSQTDPSPGGIDVQLQRSGTARGQFETTDGIQFDDDCTQSSGNVLCVTHEDQLLAEYTSVLDPKQVFTDEARWYRANFTPTPTWPPSPTPGPPTLTATPGPSPTATPVTPSPTPTPTEFPWATVVPLTAVPAGKYDVGSVSSKLPDQNLLGTYAVYAGSYNVRGQNKLYGAFHFDLSGVPANAEITKAWLDIIGLSNSNLHPELGGEWTLQVLDGSADGTWHGGGQPYFPTYRTLVEEPATVVSVGPPMLPEDLANEVVNRFVFSQTARDFLETRLGAGQVSLRLDGPLMNEFQSFTWYSGYGSGDQDKKPVLHLVYRVLGATWTPSPTPLVTATSTPTATPTATATPTSTREPTVTATLLPPPHIAFDRPAYYTTSAQAVIEVIDGRRNADPSAVEVIDVHVRSQTEPSPPGLRISLTETSSNSGRFTGLLGFSTTESDPFARRIHVSDGDWVEAIFADLESASAHWYAQAPTSTPTATATLTPTATATLTQTPTPTSTPTPTPPAWVAFDREEYLSEQAEAILTVLDPHANRSPGHIETVPVHVFSDSDTFGIVITVQESSANSGLFTSAAAGRNLYFCWLCAGSNPDEGMLKVSDGDRLTAFYDSSDPDHPACCQDTARWYLAQTPATPTLTPTPTLPATPTPTPSPTTTTPTVQRYVFLSLVLRGP